MTELTSSVIIQDDDSELNVSVVEIDWDPTLNWVVVCNPDWTEI